MNSGDHFLLCLSREKNVNSEDHFLTRPGPRGQNILFELQKSADTNKFARYSVISCS